MGLWDSIKDWFTEDEKPKLDTGKANEDQKKLLDQLNKMEENARKKDEEKYKQGLIEALPGDLDLEYMDVDKTTDSDIEKSLDGKYDEQHNEKLGGLEENFNEKGGILEREKNEKEAAAKEKSSDAEDEFNLHVDRFKNKAIKNGIIDSSIVSEQNDALNLEKEKNIKSISADYESKINDIDDELMELEFKKKSAISNLQDGFAKKISAEIETLKKKRDSNVKQANAFNNSLKQKESEFKQNKILAEQKYRDTYERNLREREINESKYGYTADRKNEYDNRVNLALDFYGKFNKADAKKMINGNSTLKSLLGNNYGTFLRKIDEKG